MSVHTYLSCYPFATKEVINLYKIERFASKNEKLLGKNVQNRQYKIKPNKLIKNI